MHRHLLPSRPDHFRSGDQRHGYRDTGNLEKATAGNAGALLGFLGNIVVDWIVVAHP